MVFYLSTLLIYNPYTKLSPLLLFRPPEEKDGKWIWVADITEEDTSWMQRGGNVS